MLVALVYLALVLSVLGAVQVCVGLNAAAEHPEDPRVPASLVASVMLTFGAYIAVAALMLVSLLVTAVT